ncbi:GDP-mannose 4,6-dehydratase [Candidatus Kaiserbacteria bacterium RIFCSPHIGHO2_02_FULL_59_21]|nr:MAG: GDP-mannose 4,6-dehydratase [Candidatus Kaiserbacteria bacterium RIFCSPHIGHO2_01_FULL_58_22]OGG67161.1 MAG: GDP-mannose 4,6-dehydratase [Candidatus Kaiserbacteria bacterium RIFCSPHIGHO2_02_FULL_59_21]OGG79048.1 MAG: GDP-mannose 4,6-dehydratase [Candidatus Kaiserbacteria bacterium RIFCSPLOWO2_01_FULL_59_34]OGG86394.1 MAG: GDP-mannose 4,6-dehydratase [Candidatus Kaiserbacteria bacterium RIFCSPLOWO2_02_FULL_59_19]
MVKKHGVFITGLTGFVGSHLADYILANAPEYTIVGLVRWRSPKDNIRHILDKVILEYGDMTDLPSIRAALEKHRPEFIFHLAAQSYVDFSFAAPLATLEANVMGTATLLEAVRAMKAQSGYDPVIHICSSSEVYGQVRKDEVPITEDNPFRPASPYAVSKVAEDMLGQQYWLSWKIRNIRTRMFTHTGPRRGEVFVLSNFAKQVAAIEAGKQRPILQVGNLASIRTFMDVRNAVEAYWLLVHKCPPGEVYNIGGAETMTIGDMTKKLLALSTVKNIKVKVDPARLRPSDVTLQIPSTKKFEKATGWKPTIPFSQTLQDTLDYWREHFERNV